uniref:RAD50-interacting protein 1 n=1 Tax=Caenorhabditis tropicalis TaxID=1561998 RepID=A0A1I7UFB3_9PELO
MQALQSRLQQLENATGSDIWNILKGSESDLIQDLSTLNTLKEDKEKKGREALKVLETKKKELKSLKKEIETLRNEYKLHVEEVEKGLKASGLEMSQVTKVFEKVLEDSLSEKKTKILQIISSMRDFKTIPELHSPLKSILELLKDPNQEKLRSMIQIDLEDIHRQSMEIFRQNLWSEFQKQGIPMKKLQETPNPDEFLQRVSRIFEFSSDLDLLLIGIPNNRIHVAFGMLSNICIDMIENEKERDADFEWILTSAHKWAKNLREVIEKATERTGSEFDEKFVEFIGNITKRFLKKNQKDPLIFTKLATLLRRFEDTCEFNLTDKDIFESLYEPEFISKWILLEIELFTLSFNQLLLDSSSFDPLPSIFIGSASSSTWASEITVQFEQWISRVEKDISSIRNPEVQTTFYECLYALMIDLCSKIHVEANRLYSEASWSNHVYLVMNTIWELRRIVKVFIFITNRERDRRGKKKDIELAGELKWPRENSFLKEN